MATHSSTLALKIPWMEELGAGYYPWGHKESGTTERLHFHFHINKMRDKSHIIISIASEKKSDKLLHSFMIKTFNKLGIEECTST